MGGVEGRTRGRKDGKGGKRGNGEARGKGGIEGNSALVVGGETPLDSVPNCGQHGGTVLP